ncbi:MAG: GDSL-type esterase/lipase family protein [Chitinivibrionales bacterium]|nr:GDSL-type esterase/lipase family protein [Chitinivibrionales bacterium]
MAQQIKWACIGNSITQGGTASFGTFKSYAVPLQSLLGTGYMVENDGVSGTCLLKGGDMPYWTKGKLANVFAFKPAIITVKLGTNDSKPPNWTGVGLPQGCATDSTHFVADLTALVDTLLTISPKPRIFLCLPCPAFYNTIAGINGSTIKNGIVPRIKRVAQAKGLTVIDINTAMAHDSLLFPDGVHPSNTGADSIAAIIYRAYMTVTGVKNNARAFAPHSGAAARTGLIVVTGNKGEVSPGLASTAKAVDLYNVKGTALGSAAVRPNGTVMVDKSKIGEQVVVVKIR